MASFQSQGDFALLQVLFQGEVTHKWTIRGFFLTILFLHDFPLRMIQWSDVRGLDNFTTHTINSINYLEHGTYSPTTLFRFIS